MNRDIKWGSMVFRMSINGLISYIHHSPLFERMFHTLSYCLRTELKDCQTVLDLGCGWSSPLQFCKNIDFSVGVEAYKPYLDKSMRSGIHSKYMNKSIESVSFPERSFDAVILIEVLEHLPNKVGKRILANAERWAKKKVIVTSPNGFIEQKSYDRNPLQRHLSGWNALTMKELGFQSKGLQGLKILRQPDSHHGKLTDTIRFRPRLFWFAVSALSQLLTYYTPSLAFDLFSVKKLQKAK